MIYIKYICICLVCKGVCMLPFSVGTAEPRLDSWPVQKQNKNV